MNDGMVTEMREAIGDEVWSAARQDSNMLAAAISDAAEACAAIARSRVNELEAALTAARQWLAGYAANGGRAADKEIAMIEAALRCD